MYLNWSIWSPHSLCYSRGVVHGITKPEHKVSNISYCTSFWCSQWPPPPACCPCYWAPWCPAGWCSGGLTVTSTALASWTLLAGSCLLLGTEIDSPWTSECCCWRGHQGRRNSWSDSLQTPAWKCTTYYSCSHLLWLSKKCRTFSLTLELTKLWSKQVLEWEKDKFRR